MSNEWRDFEIKRWSEWLEGEKLIGKPLWMNVGSRERRKREIELSSWKGSGKYEGNDWWSLKVTQDKRRDHQRDQDLIVRVRGLMNETWTSCHKQRCSSCMTWRTNQMRIVGTWTSDQSKGERGTRVENHDQSWNG